MHDLDTIHRLNAQAFAKAITGYRAQGRYVLARYDGLTLTAIEHFSELTHAQWALDLKPANAAQGERAEILAPLPSFHAARRDQSEDRKPGLALDTGEFVPAAELNKPDVTLGDYIARKTALLDNPQD